ncbi:MAG: PilT/PilU family type 4a pilus ATPase, partial [Acidimicrobiia bacterium]
MRLSSRRLGEFLVERRVLSRDVLEELLAREAAGDLPLGPLLARERLVSDEDLTAAIASELGVPMVEVAEQSILADAWRLVPEDLARAHLAVALEVADDRVLVVMEDPADDAIVEALEQALGRRVAPAVATRGQLAELVDQVYGPAPGEAPAPEAPRPAARLDALLDAVLARGASDLHLAVGAPPMLRVGGELEPLGTEALNGSDVRDLVLSALTPRQRSRFLEEGQFETSHSLPGRGRFRISAFVQRSSVGAVLRPVPAEVPDLDALGLPPEVTAWARHHRGLVLVCGSHGSGTSTTLAAMVDRINRSRSCHVLTIEEPIEFLHRHDRALVNQREVGDDTASFAVGLRHALRQDPDVVMVGELPDPETLALVLAAAETGKLVLATLRTMGAVGTVQRIVDVLPVELQQQARVQLADTLRGIVVQQRVPGVVGGMVLAAEGLGATPAVRSAMRDGDPAA